MEHLTQEIKLRVTKEMKDNLQKLADRDKRKLSDYIRLQLEQAIKRAKI